MTALRERLLVALPTSETGHDGGCVSPFSRCEVDWGSKADRLIAALGDDAARLEAALTPGAITVGQREMEERLAALAHERKWCKDGDFWSDIAHDEDSQMRPFIVRRILGIDGGQ